MVGNVERDAYRIVDAAAALRYAVGCTAHARHWIYVITGPKLQVICACRRADEGYELAISRTDRPPDLHDLLLLRKGLQELELEDVGSLIEIPRRKMAIMRVRVAPGGTP